MAGNLLTTAATVVCPHGGSASAVASQSRVQVGGQPVDTSPDTYTVSGCTFTIGNTPSPCVTIRWSMPSAQVLAGSPVLTQASTGLCLSAAQAPQGAASVVVVQTQAVAQ